MVRWTEHEDRLVTEIYGKLLSQGHSVREIAFLASGIACTCHPGFQLERTPDAVATRWKLTLAAPA